MIFHNICNTVKKLVTEMHHKSYSLPEPQPRSSLTEAGFGFLLRKVMFIVSLADCCAQIRPSEGISLIDRNYTSGSTLLNV